jgi:hypothetical protein
MEVLATECLRRPKRINQKLAGLRTYNVADF